MPWDTFQRSCEKLIRIVSHRCEGETLLQTHYSKKVSLFVHTVQNYDKSFYSASKMQLLIWTREYSAIVLHMLSCKNNI